MVLKVEGAFGAGVMISKEEGMRQRKFLRFFGEVGLFFKQCLEVGYRKGE